MVRELVVSKNGKEIARLKLKGTADNISDGPPYYCKGHGYSLAFLPGRAARVENLYCPKCEQEVEQ